MTVNQPDYKGTPLFDFELPEMIEDRHIVTTDH